MISLRKYIETFRKDADQPTHSDPDVPVPEPALSEFRAMLLSFGQAVERADPAQGNDLDRKLTGIQKTLTAPVSTGRLAQTNQRARAELSQWADGALSRQQEVDRELHEIISLLAATAGSLGERDAKYAREIGDLTERLASIAEEDDLPRIRRSIVEGARTLKDCVARMADESKASLDRLTAEVQDYRTRLEVAEQASETDPLTGLANRRAFEKHLEARIATGQPFCVILIDLNGFKQVNDRLGHVAGDDLLKQFSSELKYQFTPAEMVGRWGGDEFVVVVAGRLKNAQSAIARIRKWSLGEYKITLGEQQVKTLLSAAIGAAQWNGKETGEQLLSRADQEVYRAKAPALRAP
jgi:diguanylate cyclase (GGDEF)-like protein